MTINNQTENNMTNEKLIAEWNVAERAGLVRLRAEHEEENYFDVYGEPEGYEDVSPEQERKDIERSIELYGCYYIVSEYFDGDKWRRADSIGMCAGYKNPLSPEENCYVPDLMRSALDLIPQRGEH